jgi:hypothetical protein
MFPFCFDGEEGEGVRGKNRGRPWWRKGRRWVHPSVVCVQNVKGVREIERRCICSAEGERRMHGCFHEPFIL